MISDMKLDSNSKVLITANRHRLAELLAKGLQRKNWMTVIASDYNKLLHLLNHNHFQLLILDLDGLGEIGFTLLTQLQQKSCQIPVLILTSYEELGDRANQQFENVVNVFIKPFKIQDLLRFG